MKKRISAKKSLPIARATLLSVFLGLTLVGCGDDDNMSQEEIQYLSHLDQARFFQRQGELKASTLEARSAIELQPGNAEPYFVIINNLLTAGDAVNAERQANQLAERIDPDVMTQTVENRINLIRAKANQLRGNTEEALAHLDAIKDPDRPQEIEAALVRGDVFLNAGRLDDAELAYDRARALDGAAVKPLIGLSRAAFARGNQDRAQALISEAEELDRTDPELWLWKAQLAHANKNWQQAEEAYIRALEDIGQYDIMTYRKYATMSALVEVLRAQGKSAEAFVYEEILAKSAPGTIKSNLVAAQNAYNEGNLDEAARYLQEVLAQAPNHEQSALMLGMIRFRQGRTEEAEKLLAPLAEAEDSEAAAKLLTATKIQLRNPEEARKILDNLSDKDTDPGVLALVGIATLAGGDAKAGEELIERSLELAPDNNALRLRYARYLVQQGKTDQAIAQAMEVMERDLDSSDARLLILQAHVDAGNMDAAVESANAWVKEQPDSAPAKLARGQLALRQGDIEQAKRFFDEAAKADPDNPAPYVALGNLARSQDKPEAAAEHFKQAVRVAPDNRQALQGAATLLGRDKSASFMKEVLEENPEAIGPRLVLLEYSLTEGDAEATDNYTAELLETETADETSEAAAVVAAIYNTVARQKADEENYQRAREILDRGRALFPENEDIALQAATLAYLSDRQEQAIEIIQDTKLKHPESARPFLLQAAQMTREGRHKEAAEIYQLALEKEPSVATELRYAQALQRAGQPSKAIESLEAAQERYPGQPQVNLALALAHQEAGQADQAIQAYEALLEAEPNNVVALNNLAWMYQQANDDRAMPMAEKAYQLSPNSAAVADTYGWILFNAGKQQESLPVLEKAHGLEPNSEEIALHLVEAYKATGQDDKAKAVLEKM
ncbi:MAG: tetratricopeptide repeat protein [Marinobacter sp.]|uniref:tetratricopeptide repeat protein n=1 Tax=Marinobacter sp. TaxID=50741 RepID=UPI00299F29A0|nr:tetratricopeptide repeat protein [Marinobacter sp.]MDX1634503.1 tetratricopeptide repeat protein [Marinobacter sp.]